MKKIASIFLTSLLSISLSSCYPVFAQDTSLADKSTCLESQSRTDGDKFYLYVCKFEESQYLNIPYGLLQAIYQSPASNIYQVGPMHICPEDYALSTQSLKVTDMERPQDNIKLAASRLDDLLESNGGDIYLALVNYYHVTEEQDPFILDVLKKYYQIRSEYFNQI